MSARKEAEDFVLELVPWCPEYESCDLPWIIIDSDVVTARPAKPYMDCLVGQPKPLQNCVFGVLREQIDERFGPVSPAELDEGKIYVAAVATQGPATVLDLSYMLILSMRPGIWKPSMACYIPLPVPSGRPSARKFKDGPSIYEAGGPIYPTLHLRTILSVVVRKFYGTAASISTRATADGRIRTRIQGGTTTHEYIPTKPMAIFEAEAVAICRYLRSTTHVLGYSVVDQNYPSLARVVIDMNAYGQQMAQLRTCVDMAVTMIHSPELYFSRKMETRYAKPATLGLVNS